jgi:serine/threonine protein kinase
MTTPAPNGQDPWIGLILGNRYRLVARIGEGGMGVVYRAWDMNDDRYVVIKMPKRELIGEPDFLRRFEQELSALKTLVHDSVVPISDFGTENATPFAVMPYLAGGSLKQRIRLQANGQPRPYDLSMLWNWLPAIAHALDAVHANGFVHRDVKPDNILFDGLGRPYLSDFGVAKLVLQEEEAAHTRGLTRTGFALGTPDYMAPEIVSGATPNAAVDQYALAVVVYELVCGVKPFRGPTPAAVMVAHVTSQASPLTRIRPNIPHTLNDAVARGIDKNPSARFPRCIEFAAGVLMDIPKPPAETKTKLMCPECGRLLTVQHDWAGKKGNCPRCQSAITIGSDLLSLWIPSDRDGTGLSADGMNQTFSVTPSDALAINVEPVRRSTSHRSSRKTSRPMAALRYGFQIVSLLCTSRQQRRPSHEKHRKTACSQGSTECERKPCGRSAAYCRYTFAVTRRIT